MELNLKFKSEDFTSLSSFESAVKKQLGASVYVGTNSLCFYFEYPKELVDMLRPYPPKQVLEFKLTSIK